MADQSTQAIGKAMIVYGTVKAVSPEGVERIVTPNSPIFFHDRINTGSDGAVSIVFTDPADTQLDLGRMTDMVIDQDVIGGSPIGFEEVTAEVEAIQQALEGGGEIDVAATAAGPGGGAGPHGGLDVDGKYIVKFEADAQEVNPTFGAETQGVEHGFVGTELTPAILSEPIPVAPVAQPEFIRVIASEPVVEAVLDLPDDIPPPPVSQLYPPVDYDVSVQANYVQELPFGFAEGLGGDGSGAMDAVITEPGYYSDATNGSAIKTTLNVNAGDVVSFDWFFDADDYASFADFSFVVINGNLTRLAGIPDVGSYNATGWATYQFIAEGSGPLTIGFGVMNTGDSGVNSHLIIDNLEVNGAPVGNSGFESGDFTGWQTTGNVGVVTSHDEGGGVPSEGSYMALMTSTSDTYQAELESFLGMNGASFGPGYLYEFQVGQAELVDDNIHGTDVEDGVTVAFTITSLPVVNGSDEQLGVLLVDTDDDGVIDEIYGSGFDPIPPGGINISSGDSVYYFLEQGAFEVLPDSVSFNYVTTDSDGMVSDGAVITVSFEDIPEAFPGEAAVDEEGLLGGNPGTEYGDGSDLAGAASAATGYLSYDFGDNGPNAVTPFTWSTDGLPALSSAGSPLTYEVSSDGLVLLGHTGDASDPVIRLTLVDVDTGEYDFEVLRQLDHGDANTEDDIVFNIGYTVMDGDGDTSSSVLAAAVDDDSPQLTGEFAYHQVEEEGLDNFDPDHNVDGDGTEGSTGNEDATGNAEFGGPGLVTATGNLSAMVSGGVDQPLTFGFVADVQTALDDANGFLTSQQQGLVYSVDGNTLTAMSEDGRVVFTLEITDTATGAYEFTLVDQLDHAVPDPGTAVENSLTINLGAALQAVDSDDDAVSFGSIDTGDGLVDGLTVEVADDIPVAAQPEQLPGAMNLVLMLDNSGSMYDQNIAFGDDTISRAAAMQLSIASLLANLGTNAEASGATYQVHVVEYNTDANTVGTFTVTDTGSATDAADAIAAGIVQPVFGTGDTKTNFEAAFQRALDWIVNGSTADTEDPLTGPDVVNKALFISDGDPNRAIDDVTDNVVVYSENETGYEQALNEVTNEVAGPSNDGSDEVEQLLAQGYELEVIGLNVDTAQLGRLSKLDSGARNIDNADDLVTAVPGLLMSTVPIISAIVEEDDLDSAEDAADDLDDTVAIDDNADGINEDLSMDADETDDTVGGNLNDLFVPGADENLTFSINPAGALPTLYSGGLEVEYDFSTPGTLVAYVDDGGAITTVFTFSVNESDGTWSFDLDGELDHIEGGGENFELRSGPDGQDSVDGIDLSSIILATDADGDSVPASSGAFLIKVQDDEPKVDGAVGYTFGFSSYTGAEDDFNGADHQVVFDVLADYGSDGPAGGTPEIVLSNQVGGGEFQVVAGQVIFAPDESWSGESEITYEITDGDGDTVQATLKVVENKLIVGNNFNDTGAGSSNQPYVLGTGADGYNYGEIDGGAGNDILIGDYGGVSSIGGNLEIMFILDVSGSMGTSASAGEPTKLAGLKTAMNTALNSLAADPGASEVRVHIVQFSDNASLVGAGTYDLSTDLTAATTAINSLTSGGYTNYEAGMKLGLATAAANPLADAEHQVFFISDGEPNRAIDDTTLNIQFFSDSDPGYVQAFNQVNGVGDASNEIAQLEAWAPGQVEAIFISDDGDAADLTRMNDIASGDAYFSNPADIAGIIIGASGSEGLAAVGDDTIAGGEGDDLIFGDALFTDGVVANLIADIDHPDITAGYTTGLDAGSGWAVFQALEADLTIDWTRTDTINYILEHQAELALESTSAGDPPVADARDGGDDTIDAGAGEDLVYGQEGDDDIQGNLGDDVLLGGSGDDTIDGNDGNDFIVGDIGDDVLSGNEGSDILIGGAGADELQGDGGSDDGDDILVGDAIDFGAEGTDDSAIVDDGEVDDIYGGGGTDTVVNDLPPITPGDSTTIPDENVGGDVETAYTETDLNDILIPPPEDAV